MQRLSIWPINKVEKRGQKRNERSWRNNGVPSFSSRVVCYVHSFRHDGLLGTSSWSDADPIKMDGNGKVHRGTKGYITRLL